MWDSVGQDSEYVTMSGGSFRQRALRFLGRYSTYILGAVLLIFVISTIALAARGRRVVTVIEYETTTEVVTPSPTCSDPPIDTRRNCQPDGSVTKESCEERNCCFNNVSSISEWAPSCYFPENYVGYSASILEEDASRILVMLERNGKSGFPKDVARVQLEITFVHDDLVRFKLTDARSRRFEVPMPTPLNLRYDADVDKLLYDIDVSSQGILTIRRNFEQTSKILVRTVLLETDLRRLIFSDQFIQIDWDLPTNIIYGLSEHKADFRKNVTWSKYTIFNRGDQPTQGTTSTNLYGTHPMYMMLDDHRGNAHGVFLLNSNAMEIILQPAPAITWRTIGGILDFFVYLGPTPRDVVKQHSSLVGKPALPPYWMLGFHLCRYGYNSLEETEAAWNRTVTAGIPLDAQWNDIDVMSIHNDFTYDKEKFTELPAFVKKLHDNGMRYVLILDPGVSDREPNKSYPLYDEGMAWDIFVKDHKGVPLRGSVWNRNTTVFVDFTNPKGQTFWSKQITKFYGEIEFDALWVDMNEPYSFKFGSVEDPPCPEDPLESPPYLPGAPDPLQTGTICMTAQHFLGSHYNVHSLYAFYETVATNYALAGLRKKRPFVLSRGTFAGHGQFGGHWSGDINSDWDHMKWSITSIMEFNIYGVPMIGADICGFQYNTTMELCARWSSLGAFYPFSRNHNDWNTIEQDPAIMGPEVEAAAKNALKLRYTLLPHLYTLFYHAHIFGDPVIRPLFFEYPEDVKTHEIDTQFLWGSSIMIVPILIENTNETNAYFPAGKWYDIRTRELEIDAVNGTEKVITLALEDIKVVLKAGAIIPTQDDKQTTTESRQEKFRIVAALDNDIATGDLFWDDGDSLYTTTIGSFNTISFDIRSNNFTSTPTVVGFYDPMVLDEVDIVGISKAVTTVLVNGKPITPVTNADGRLTVKDLALDLKESITITWQ